MIHRAWYQLIILALLLPFTGLAGLRTSWLWHLHQPIYWPDRQVVGPDRYEAAWDTIQQQDGGRGHPDPEVLREIFGKADRVAAYQGGLRDALSGIGGALNSGAQVSYSGALMENIESLGSAGQLGYGSGWDQANQTARGWTTTGGKPRLDLVNFTYHHSLAPLLSEETLEMELRLHRRQMELFWGTSPSLSRGYFPTETCFSTRLIPVLRRVGIEWAVVANSHLSRACADFPLVIGAGGENCDIPNRADQLNPAQGVSNYKRLSIDRGISPAAAMPFAYQLHHVRHIDPESGEELRLMIVPSDQALGWKDSFGTWDLGLLDDLNARNDPSNPALVLLAHDGDNAWSGGFSYYQEWLPNFSGQAASRGHELTTVEQFLLDHTPAPAGLVHIEDGGWVYADSDFGSPIFINWHWPPSLQEGGVNVVDPSRGVSDKADNWRVILATENRVKTAQQISGSTPRIDQVRDPGAFGQTPTAVELGWHYYLGGLDSGFVYFGCVGDECHRATVAQANVMRHVDSILAGGSDGEETPPTIFLPQRHPWNPGGTNFGVQYSYRLKVFEDPSFWVWTYAYDVSGIQEVRLHYRDNGLAAPRDVQFHTYAGGVETGPWVSTGLVERVVAPVIGVTPGHLADYYWAKVSGITNSFVDYYVSAVDVQGNTTRSDIQHVWVGGGGGEPGGPPSVVATVAATALSSNQVRLSWSSSAGADGYEVERGGLAGIEAVETTYLDDGLEPGTVYCYRVRATNEFGASGWSVEVCATTLDPGQTQPPPEFSLDGQADSDSYLWSSPGMTIYAAVRGVELYVATWSSGNSGPNDHFILVADELLAAATEGAPWAKAGMVAMAGDKPFLGAESVNDYIGWANAPESAAAKAPSNSAQMEGTLDLVATFGVVPPVIYLAAAAYATADGGALVAQAPEGMGPDIDRGEFLAIPTVALADNNGDGLYDRLDPEMDFRLVIGRQEDPGEAVLEWAAMPKETYQLESSASLEAGWEAVGAAVTADPLEVVLERVVSTGQTQRFYRVERLVSPQGR